MNIPLQRSICGRSHYITLQALALSVGLVVSPLGAMAADTNIDSTNSRTGPYSENNNTVVQDSNVNFSATNNATATNVFAISANTGNNSVTENTTVGNVSTGDIELDLSANTELNNGGTVSMSGLGGSSVNVDNINHITGPYSSNTNTQIISSNVSVSHTNNADVFNLALLDLNTGGNDTSRNTTVGNVSTGDIRGSISFNSVVNGPVRPGSGGTGGTGGTTGGAGGGATGGTVTTTTTTSGAGGARITAATVTEAVHTAITLPARGGVGGAFFPAGSNGANLITVYLLLLLASVAVLFSPELRRLVYSRIRN